MGRAPCCDKANVKKGPWAPEEDAKLKRFIETNGTGGNWITLPSKAGLRRCGKSCRLRWTNYLRPDIRHGKFTDEEEKIIIYWHNKKGSRWSQIAAMLEGRTDNDIKNFWNTRLKKKLAEPVAEKWTNSSFSHQQQQYRSHHMRSAPGPMFAAGVSQPEGITVSPLSIDHQTAQYPAQYLEQQCDNAAERRSQAEPFALISPGLMQERELQWNERLRSRPIAPETYDAEKLRNMVGELGQLCEISPDASDSVKSTRTSDILQQWSSFSPCDNWSHDAYYADSSYVDNVNLPPPLEDVPSHHVPPLANDLPSPALFASDGRAIREEDPAFFDMRALLADVQGARLPPFDLYDAHTTPPVKEEMYTDFSTSELISSPPVRGFSSISHNQRYREAAAAYRSGMRPPQQDTSFLRKWKGLIDNQYVSVPGRTR